MFFIIINFLILGCLSLAVQVSGEESNIFNHLLAKDSAGGISSIVRTYSWLTFILVKCFAYHLVSGGVVQVGWAMPIASSTLLRRADSPTLVVSSLISVLLLLSTLNLHQLIKFLVLESIYVLLGSILTTYQHRGSRISGPANLYDYFATNMSGVVFGIGVVSLLPDQFGCTKLQFGLPAAATGAITAIYYNLKLFLGPIFLVKYAPFTVAGNNIILYIVLTASCAAVSTAVPMLLRYTDKSISAKLTGFFLVTQLIIVARGNSRTLKEFLLVSTPLLNAPLIGAFASI